MALYRTLLIDTGSELVEPIHRALEGANSRVRRARIWQAQQDVGERAQQRANTEWVTFSDWEDDVSWRRLGRGCNYVIYPYEPVWCGSRETSRGHGVRTLRTLAAMVRQTQVERVVLTSCASMLGREPGAPFYTTQTGWLPHERARWTMRARYAMEQDAMRFLADALPLVVLYPGLIVPHDGVMVSGVKLDGGVASVCTHDYAARAHVLALSGLLAPGRYGLSQGVRRLGEVGGVRRQGRARAAVRVGMNRLGRVVDQGGRDTRTSMVRRAEDVLSRVDPRVGFHVHGAPMQALMK